MIQSFCEVKVPVNKLTNNDDDIIYCDTFHIGDSCPQFQRLFRALHHCARGFSD